MTMKKCVFYAFAALGLAFFSSCTSTQPRYGDASEARILGMGVGSYDLQQNTVAMVDSLLANPVLDRKLTQQFPGKTPTISVTQIKNETMQLGLNMKSLSDAISTRLINSGKFDFMDLNTNPELLGVLVNMMDSPLTDESKMIALGTHDTPDYILNGTLVEMRESSGKIRETYLKLTMRLFNLRTGKIDWADDHEIRKTQRKSSVAW
jgi:uncharacterized protein (TIGR02722 family)